MPDHTKIEVRQIHEDLYTRYGDDMMRFATGLVGPSDAMLRFWRSRALLDAENPRALLYRGVLAAARSWQRAMFRRTGREQRTAERLVIHDPDIRPDGVDAVLRLSPRQRACVFLAYWEDLPVDQIAGLPGFSSVPSDCLPRGSCQCRPVTSPMRSWSGESRSPMLAVSSPMPARTSRVARQVSGAVRCGKTALQ